MSAVRSTTPYDRGQIRSARGTSEFSKLARMVRGSGLLRRRYGYYWAKLIGLP